MYKACNTFVKNFTYQRLTASLLTLSTILQSCYNPLANLRAKAPSYTIKNESAYLLSNEIDKKTLLSNYNPLKIVQTDPEIYPKWDEKYVESEEMIEAIKPASSDTDTFKQEIQIIFYQHQDTWRAKINETSGPLERSEDLHVVCAPNMQVETLEHMPKLQAKQFIHRIKHPKKNFIYLGKMGLPGGMMEEGGKKEQATFLLHQSINSEKKLSVKNAQENDQSIASHGLNNDCYWYSVADGMRLNIAIRQSIFDYTNMPIHGGEEYSALRENHHHIFLADPYHIDNFATSLQDDVNVLINRWYKMPTSLLIPVLGGMHWRIVAIAIDYEQRIVKICWDDPYGANHFPMHMRHTIVNGVIQEVRKLIQRQTGDPRVIIQEFDKGIDQQGSGRNDWDCGPIVFSNLVDYIQTFKGNQLLTYSIGAHNAENHGEQIFNARKRDYNAYCQVAQIPIDTEKLANFKKYTEGISQDKLKKYNTTLASSYNSALEDEISRLSSSDLEILFTILDNKRLAENLNLTDPYSQEELFFAYQSGIQKETYKAISAEKEKLIDEKESSLNQAETYYFKLLEAIKLGNKNDAINYMQEGKKRGYFEAICIYLTKSKAVDDKFIDLIYVDDTDSFANDLEIIQDDAAFNYFEKQYTEKLAGERKFKKLTNFKNSRLKLIKKARRYKKVSEIDFNESEDAKEQEKELITLIEKISKPDLITTSKNTINRVLTTNTSYCNVIGETVIEELKASLKTCLQPEEILVLDPLFDAYLSEVELNEKSKVFSQICNVQKELAKQKHMLEKANLNAPKLLNTHEQVLTHLDDINKYYTEYINKVCASRGEARMLQLESKILLQSDGMYRYLEKLVANQIIGNLDKDGDLEKDEKQQLDGHKVVRQIKIAGKNNGLFFKFKPHSPGIEFMVSKLLDRIYLTAATRLVNIKRGDKDYPFIVSKEVKGEDLGYFLKTEAAEFLPKLDPKNFACIFFLSLLTNPRDGKEDNYFVTFDKEANKYKIISIDNDMSFVSEGYENFDGIYKVNVRSLLYFFPQMQCRIDSTFRDEFLELLPEVLILTWLEKLERQNISYDHMKEDGVFTELDYKGDGKIDKYGELNLGMQLPIKLRKGLVNDLYEKLCKIQDYMEINPELTYQELFEEVTPKVAKVYQEVLKEVAADLVEFSKKSKEKIDYNEVTPDLLARMGEKILACRSTLTKNRPGDDDFTQEVTQAIGEFLESIKREPIVEKLLTKLFTRNKLVNVDSKSIITTARRMSSVVKGNKPQDIGAPLVQNEKVTENLKKYYQHSFSEVKPWFEDGQALPIEKAQFQLLALEQKNNVKDSQQEDEKEEEKSSQLSEYKQGIYHVEKPIELVDLFKPRISKQEKLAQEVKKVLLVGEQGTGKTTVSHKLAYLWSQGQLDQSLETVYVVPVRELQQANYDNNGHFKREENLATAIMNICFPWINKAKEYTELRESIEASLEQPNTLIVLDGLDERHGASERIIAETQKGKHKLLILSRPYGLEEVRKEIDLEVIHAGFTPGQLQSYIKSYFTGQEKKRARLLQFIDSNQMLKNLLHVPVNACIVCTIWKDKEDELGQYTQRGSLSDLYDQMTNYTWERYAEKINKGKKPNEMLDNEARDKLFDALGRIALAALEKGEVLINSSTVRDVLRELPKNTLIESMLKPSGLVLFQQTKIFYQFPHLTFQEYFAGKELARQLFSENTKEQKSAKKFLAIHKYETQYRVMLAFMAGEISKKQGEKGITHILRVIKEEPQELVGVQQLFLELHCLNEHLLLEPNDLKAIEKEFKCIARLVSWFEQGIVQARYGYGLLMLLTSTLQGMPAIAKEAQSVVESLVCAAQDFNSDVRKVYIGELCKLGKIILSQTPAVITLLGKASMDKDSSVRYAAIHGLREIGKAVLSKVPEIIKFLVHAAKDSDSYVSNAAHRDLCEIVKIDPSQAQDPLVMGLLGEFFIKTVRHKNRNLDNDDNFITLNALYEVVKVVPAQIPAVVKLLMRNAGDKEYYVSSFALHALERVIQEAPEHAQTVIKVVLQEANDEDKHVRCGSIRALGALVKSVPAQAPAVLKALVCAIEDQDLYISRYAILALGELIKAASEHAEVVLEKLKNAACYSKESLFRRETASSVLADIVKAVPEHASAVIERLLRAAVDQDCKVRKAAIFALKNIIKKAPGHAPAVIERFLHATIDQNADVRYAAISGLIELVKVDPGHVPAVIERFISATIDQDADVRYAAISGLIELVKVDPGHTEAILEIILQAQMDQKKYYLSCAAISALAEIVKTAPRHAPVIIKRLQQAAVDEDWKVRRAAISGLIELVKAAPEHAPAILEILQCAAGDQDKDVASYALSALGEFVKASPEHSTSVLEAILLAARDKKAHVSCANIINLCNIECELGNDVLQAFSSQAQNIISLLEREAMYSISSVRCDNIRDLGKVVKVMPLKAQDIAETILQTADNEDIRFRYAACSALSELVKSTAQVPEVIKLLSSAAKAPNPNVRYVAIKALDNLLQVIPSQAPAVVQILQSAAVDKDTIVCSAVISVLEKLAKAVPSQAIAAVEMLVHMAGNSESYIGVTASHSLSEVVQIVPSQEVVDLLLCAAENKEYKNRKAAISAIEALAKVAPEYAQAAVETLLQAIGEQNADIRFVSLSALYVLSLKELTQMYFAKQDSKLLSYILKRAWEYPLVIEDSKIKKSFKRLVVYTTTGSPEVLGEYSTQAVQEFLQHIKLIDYEKEEKNEKIEQKNEAMESKNKIEEKQKERNNSCCLLS
jgi:DNA polymerase III delta prime subunit